METMGVKFVKDFTRPLTVDQESGWDVRKEGNSSIESTGTKLHTALHSLEHVKGNNGPLSTHRPRQKHQMSQD